MRDPGGVPGFNGSVLQSSSSSIADPGIHSCLDIFVVQFFEPSVYTAPVVAFVIT